MVTQTGEIYSARMPHHGGSHHAAEHLDNILRPFKRYKNSAREVDCIQNLLDI